MMLPPIHKQAATSSANVDASKRRGSVSSETSGVNQSERAEADLAGGRSTSLLNERLLALERENEQIREEMHRLRVRLSNNHSREDEKVALSKVSDELHRVVQAYNSKAQADSIWQQREQQKAALLFAEVVRLAHSLETLDHAVRNLGDDTRRRLDHHDHQLAQMSSLSSSLGASQMSPTKRSRDEFYRQNEEIQWLKHALTQLRSELESDRNERWKVESERSQWAADFRAAVVKTETTMDSKIASHLERVHSKLVADKVEIVRTLDEYRELMTGADFKRMSSQMLEFSRINDHLHALERWIHGEHGKIKRVLQSMQTDHEGRVQLVVDECASILKLLSGLMQQQDDDWRVQLGAIQEAITEVVTHVQHKVFALEEVVPMEVKTRQAHDEKLRQRLDIMVRTLSRAIETIRNEAFAAIASSTAVINRSPIVAEELGATTLLKHRVEVLEIAHTEAIRRVDEQLDKVKVAIATKIASSQLPIVSTEQLHEVPPQSVDVEISGGTTVAFDKIHSELNATSWRAALKQQASELFQPFIEELTGRQNELVARLEKLEDEQGDAITSLQRWSATHAQECRQCYEYTQWTLDQTLTESAVQHTLDRLVDGVLWLSLDEGD